MFFYLQTMILGSFNEFLNFLAENDTERSWNHHKQQALEPKRAVMIKKTPLQAPKTPKEGETLQNNTPLFLF